MPSKLKLGRHADSVGPVLAARHQGRYRGLVQFKFKLTLVNRERNYQNKHGRLNTGLESGHDYTKDYKPQKYIKNENQKEGFFLAIRVNIFGPRLSIYLLCSCCQLRTADRTYPSPRTIPKLVVRHVSIA